MDGQARRAAIVTGGSRGIGRAICIRLARDGLDVVVVYRSQQPAAERVVAEIGEMNAAGIAVAADVRIGGAVAEMVAQVHDRFSRIDVLINNAGIAHRMQTVELTSEQWSQVIDTNLTGAFNCGRAVIPDLIKSPAGRIVNISSIGGQIGGAVGPHYASSKGGLLALTYYWARELAAQGVTVNAVAPGGIETDMLTRLGQPTLQIPMPPRPLGRGGHPDEVAAAVSYLVSEEAAYVTGQTLSVSGGSVMG